MPGKARRVASRQAQLGRRRKRQQNRPEDGQAAVSETEPVEKADQQASTDISNVQEAAGPDAVAAEPSVVDEPETPTPAARQAPRPSRPQRPSPVAARSADGELAPARSGARGRRDRISAQANIGAEIRRILAMSSTVLVVIIVLGIVL